PRQRSARRPRRWISSSSASTRFSLTSSAGIGAGVARANPRLDRRGGAFLRLWINS
uniref:Copper-containing nitrite reductase n=1 Tax=Mesocestoides corti TaxID=53468 RepID=A0A5K3G5D7_MESCO